MFLILICRYRTSCRHHGDHKTPESDDEAGSSIDAIGLVGKFLLTGKDNRQKKMNGRLRALIC